jgi:hypothetical protein
MITGDVQNCKGAKYINAPHTLQCGHLKEKYTFAKKAVWKRNTLR